MKARSRRIRGGGGAKPGREIVLFEPRLDLSPVDVSLAEQPEHIHRRRSLTPASVLRLLGAGAVAGVLGWTVYYDLLARHPPAGVPTSTGPAAADLAAAPFPANGTVVADFQEAAAQAGLTIQTPADDPGRLYVLALEDWQTGSHVAHAFLRANTVVTIRLPPARYRLVMASGPVWFGQHRLFGIRTQVEETLRPVEPAGAGSSAQRLIWGVDPRYPITQVPAELFSTILADRG